MQPTTPYNQMMQVDVGAMSAHMQAMTIGPASPADQQHQPFTPHVYTYVVPRMAEQQPPSGQPSPGHHVYVPVQPQYSTLRSFFQNASRLFRCLCPPLALISALFAVHGGGVPIHYQQQQQPIPPGGVQYYVPTAPAQPVCSPATATTVDDHAQVSSSTAK